MADNVRSDKKCNHSKIKGVTKGKAFNVTYEWTIHNFNITGKKQSEYLPSAIFSSPYSNLRWQLMFYPKGKEWDTCLSVYLKFYPCWKYPEIEAAFKIQILDDKKERLCSENSTNFFNSTNCSRGFNYYSHQNKLIELIRNCLPSDCLTLVCEITYCIDVVNLPNEVDEIPSFIDSHFGKLQSGYKALFNSQELSDVILSASGKELRAHKSILAAQSPVFLTMFGSDMKEKSDNRVDIVDVDFDVLQEMLRYIYSGEVKNMPAIVNDLMAASEKYNVEALKNECEQYFCKHLNVDNVMDVNKIADLYNASVLKNYTLKFMRIHEEELLGRNVADLRDKLNPIVLARRSREGEANLLAKNRLNRVGRLCLFVASSIACGLIIRKILCKSPERIVIQSPISLVDHNTNVFSRFAEVSFSLYDQCIKSLPTSFNRL